MSEPVVKEDRQVVPYMAAISKAQTRFIEIVGGDKRRWDTESIFAMQHIAKNDYAMQVANRNPMSVQLAMYNAASTGLTLNPANAYAYLVPRDNAIKLDISYKGLIKIATDTGSILWGRAELVYEADTFVYNGPASAPAHTAQPFKKDRGELVGVYCIAKTHGGDILTEVMDIAELEKIRDKSDAWAKKKAGPWRDWFTEMARKAVIKRAQKTWPYTDKSEKLAEAIQIANDAEGGYTLEGESYRVGKLSPFDGALEHFDDEELEFLKGIAGHVQQLADKETVEDAEDYLNSQHLEAEEYLAVCALIPYPTMKAIRKVVSNRKKQENNNGTR